MKKTKVLIKIYHKAISKFEDTMGITWSCLSVKEYLCIIIHPCVCSNETVTEADITH